MSRLQLRHRYRRWQYRRSAAAPNIWSRHLGSIGAVAMALGAILLAYYVLALR